MQPKHFLVRVQTKLVKLIHNDCTASPTCCIVRRFAYWCISSAIKPSTAVSCRLVKPSYCTVLTRITTLTTGLWFQLLGRPIGSCSAGDGGGGTRRTVVTSKWKFMLTKNIFFLKQMGSFNSKLYRFWITLRLFPHSTFGLYSYFNKPFWLSNFFPL